MSEAGRILIAGTGALACAVGARLARGGAQVTLAGTWREALAAISTRGLRVHELGANGEVVWSVPAAAIPIDGPIPPFPLAIVLVKSHQTPVVAAALGRALAPSGLALTLQNGLGHRETLTAAVGASRVATGVAVLGAMVLAPGGGRSLPGRVVIGTAPHAAQAIARLVESFEAAGIPAETSAAIDSVVWQKLAVNCAVNPLTALHGVTNGALLDDPVLRDEMVEAAREVGAVAAACGIRLEGDPGELASKLARTTATNRSSMLQDLERGARTEIDALNGAVVREARRVGVATPVNERLFRLVRAREGRPLERESGA